MKKKERKLRVNNSQRMLQALEEPRFKQRRISIFIKPSKMIQVRFCMVGNSSRGDWFLSSGKEIYLKYVTDFPEVNLNLGYC